MLSDEVERLIVLDADVAVLRDVAELHAEFAAFTARTMIGLVDEQSTLYGPYGRGKNGGVQLLHLDAMRRDPRYEAALARHARGTRRIGYLGDQTLYTWMVDDGLVHRLPCVWNRQLSPHFGFANASSHACAGRCGILHANHRAVKCLASAIQRGALDCAAWRARPVPRGCPALVGPALVAFWRAAATHFGDCCVERLARPTTDAGRAPSASATTGGAETVAAVPRFSAR